MRYRMTDEELGELLKAAQTPGVFTGGILAGYHPALAAIEKVWQRLGKKYGFDWRTARPVPGQLPVFFEAEPKAQES